MGANKHSSREKTPLPSLYHSHPLFSDDALSSKCKLISPARAGCAEEAKATPTTTISFSRGSAFKVDGGGKSDVALRWENTVVFGLTNEGGRGCKTL